MEGDGFSLYAGPRSGGRVGEDDADVKTIALSPGRSSRASHSPTPAEPRTDTVGICSMVSLAVEGAMSTSVKSDCRVVPLTGGVLGLVVTWSVRRRLRGLALPSMFIPEYDVAAAASLD